MSGMNDGSEPGRRGRQGLGLGDMKRANRVARADAKGSSWDVVNES